MYIYSIISFLVSACYLCLGLFAFAKGKNKYVSWVFLLLCSCFYLLSFPYTFLNFVDANSGAYLFLRFMIYLGSCFAPALFLHLALLITNKVTASDKSVISVYMPQVLLIITCALYLFGFNNNTNLKLLIDSVIYLDFSKWSLRN
jgi:hypothetical protein